MSKRSTVDTIIQSAAVDLLHSLDIAAAPLPPVVGHVPHQLPDLSAFVRFDAPGCTGVLCLGCPRRVIELAVGASADAVKEDWIREAMNQLMGRVKKRFLQFGVALRTSLPAPADNRFLVQHFGASTSRSFEFRTIRGNVIVLLDATIDDERLVYCGDVSVRGEGDIILF